MKNLYGRLGIGDLRVFNSTVVPPAVRGPPSRSEPRTTTGRVRSIRSNATKRFLQELVVTFGKDDMVADERRYGYCLSEWIVVHEAARAVGRDAVTS